MSAERALMALLLAGIAFGCVFVLYPFLSAILWAAILTFTTWPVFQVIRQRVGRLPAAGVMVTVTAVVVVLPITLAAPTNTGDVANLERIVQGWLDAGLPGPPAWVAGVPGIGPAAADLLASWAADLSGVVEVLRPYFGMAAQFGLRLLLSLANGVLEFALALFIAFFLYASGDQLAERLVALTRRIAGVQADRLIDVTGATVRGVVYGIMGTAVVQGILSTFGLWLAGVPRPALLGLVAGALSVLPVGAPVVWIPAGLWLLSEGKTVNGIFLLAWGGIVISGADTLIRPFFIARGANLPFALTLLGVLGGALGFGLLGVFMGPVLLGVGFMLVNEFALGVAGRERE